MIQVLTKLGVADNSGVNVVLCIHILYRKKRLAMLGDKLVVSVRSVSARKSIDKGTILLAILVRRKKWTYRSNGVFVSFKSNCVVLVDPKTKNFLGTRIRGPVPQELRQRHSLRIVCLATMVV